MPESKYTPELAAEICKRLESGHSLRAVCRDLEVLGCPGPSGILGWIEDHQEFGEQYARARATGYKLLADELVEIADDGTNDFVKRQIAEGVEVVDADHEHINRSRLRLDTRKWLLSKMLPKLYGDKLTTEITGADGGPIKVQDPDRAAKLLELFAAIGQRATDDVV